MAFLVRNNIRANSECNDASSTCGSDFPGADFGWFLLALFGVLIAIGIVGHIYRRRTNRIVVRVQPSDNSRSCAPNYAPSWTPNHPAIPQYSPPTPSPSLLRGSYAKSPGSQPYDSANAPQIPPATYSNI